MEIIAQNKTAISNLIVTNYSRRTLRAALDRFSSRVASVKVTLNDVNGPRGGLDKECKIYVRLAGGVLLTTRTLAKDVFEAISLCADKCKRRVAKFASRGIRRGEKRARKSLEKSLDLDQMAMATDWWGKDHATRVD